MTINDNFTPQLTADGSFTFFSQEFSEAFHSNFGARQESFLKFVSPTQLEQKAKLGKVRILDVCYGLGYNTAAALQTIWTINPHCFVEIIALELNPKVPQAAINNHLFDNWNCQHTNILTQLAFEYQATTEYLTANLLIGDARKIISQVYSSGFQADAIFLDPFSPPQCPQLWTIEFIEYLSKCLHINGLLATYSCAAAVRTALLAAGLAIANTSPVGRKTPGTVAAFHEFCFGKQDLQPKIQENQRLSPYIPETANGDACFSKPQTPHQTLQSLSQAEIEHLKTRAAIPYRDPQLNDSSAVILQRRQKEQLASSLEPTSHWQKRWKTNRM